MPELPEVERARKLIEESCKGYKIKDVKVTEDKLVYAGGTDHNDFVKELKGRTITGCERKGKNFWITLSGGGRLPVLHFGMTGMVQLQGQEPTWYRRKPKEMGNEWPPKFWKFTLDLEPQEGSVGHEPRALAFMDGRRLGRIRLLPEPILEQKPISDLGFDPLLSYPSIEEFKGLLGKKKGTIKGVIMDQAFSAGVGNWVADEILYQARIHPSCPVPSLSDQNIIDLHHQIHLVPKTAVDVNADSKQFPEDWLFRWRWSKGKKDKASRGRGKAKGNEDEEDGEDVKPQGKEFLALPDGKPATIEWIEVGGRTTAIVKELQRMPEGVEIKPKVTKGSKKNKGSKNDSEDASDLSELEEEKPVTKATTPRQKAAAKKIKVEQEDHVAVGDDKPAKRKKQATDQTVKSETTPKKPRKSSASDVKPTRGRKSKVKVEVEEDGSDGGSSVLSDAPE